MAKDSNIQWTDGTTNPGMGCPLGCELFPPPVKVRSLFLGSLLERYAQLDGNALKLSLQLIFDARTTTEIWHERYVLVKAVMAFCNLPSEDAEAIRRLLEKHIKCYAGRLHFRHGHDNTKPDKKTNKGYAQSFEQIALFPGRTTEAATWSSLLGKSRPEGAWKNGLPRLIFVSDMGDILSPGVTHEYLKQEIVDVARSEKGSRHIWQWLTKRPAKMIEFSSWLIREFGAGFWPDNLIAMTSVTSQETAYRVDQLRQVSCRFRGLSVEPLWTAVELDLREIDWVVCGGESGGGAEPFELNWARSLKHQCGVAKTAFFVKQLGAAPLNGGVPIKLRNSHGGDWSEWPDDLRVREFPQDWYQPLYSTERTQIK